MHPRALLGTVLAGLCLVAAVTAPDVAAQSPAPQSPATQAPAPQAPAAQAPPPTSAPADSAAAPAPFAVLPVGAAPPLTVPVGNALPTAIGAAPDGGGAWLAAADGIVTAAGGAPHRGDTAGLHLAQPVVDLAVTVSGGGYWLAAADGGIFAFGDAAFRGGAATLPLVSPIVAIEPTPDGRGYWLLGGDGGVFTYGSARYHGSLPQIGVPGQAVAMVASPTGRGYLISTADGGVFNFGDSAFAGSLFGQMAPDDEVVDAAAHGDRYRLLTDRARVVTFTPRRRLDSTVRLPAEHHAVAFALDPLRDRGWVLSRYANPFTIAFSGDLLPHISVVNTARNYGLTTGWAYDFAPMFDEVRPLLSAADLAICHLETTLSVTDRDLSGYPLFRSPGELADAIRGAGYDGCSVASNHALDFGFDGVVTTLNQLDRAGVGHAGTARSAAEAATPTMYQVGGVRIAHLSFSYGFNGAAPPREAPWAANRIDRDRILADASAARRAGADLVVVSLHWGSEYRPAPTADQRTLGSELLASPDIDLLIGHHAHVVQPIERMGDEFVVYGLGNFLSGQSAPPRRDGVIVFVDVEMRPAGPRVERVRYQPTWVDRPNVIRVARPDGPLVASWQRTKAVVELLGTDPSIQPAL
jgi:Bacterial capsule synthesis protein PGA_cap